MALRINVTPSRVYVVQEPRNPERVNIEPAREHGELVVLFGRDVQVSLSSDDAVRHARQALHDFMDEDFIVPMGDPVLIGAVCAEASRQNGGRFKMLKWDRMLNDNQGGYHVVQFDLNV